MSKLIEQHDQHLERIVELERMISEATAEQHPKPKARPSKGSEQTPDAPRTKLTPDEAIQAEEAALKILEASIKSQRKPITPGSPSSPVAVRSPNKSPAAATTSQTPARTPKAMPTITNSLVSGTPFRSGSRKQSGIDRFSPLRLIGTPREKLPPSALRSSGTRTSIFARPSTTPRRAVEFAQADQSMEEPGLPAEEDETIRLALTRPIDATDATPEKASASLAVSSSITPKASPRKVTPGKSPRGTKRVEGVDVSLDVVRMAVVCAIENPSGRRLIVQQKIHETLTEVMQQGVPHGEAVGRSIEETV